jgi:hypothetical protein
MAEKRRKPAGEMTSDEIAHHVFPPEVHEHLKRTANPPEGGEGSERSRPPSRKSRKSS